MVSTTPPTRYVIVGNGIAGTTAAETLRRGDPQAKITIIGNEPYPLYNRVALPRVVKLKTPLQRVIIRDLDFHRKHRLDLLLETTVTHVDVEQRIVSTDRAGDLPYDALLIASGGRPNHLGVPGAEGTHGICHFQSLSDTKELLAGIAKSRQIITVGGSYLAYELTEVTRSRGLEVLWLIRGPHFLRRVLDDEGGALVDRIARDAGVVMHYGEEIAQVHAKSGAITGLTTTGGHHFTCDLLGVGMGLTLNMDFLAGTPVETRKGVVTNEHLETSVPSVYAAGDVAEFYDVYIGQHHAVGTWNSAGAHGRTAAANMLGGCHCYAEVPYHSATLFDSTLTVIGATPEDRPDLESLTHIDWAQRVYKRLFFLEDRLVGAALIGDNRPRRQITNLIKSREPIAPADRPKLLQA